MLRISKVSGEDVLFIQWAELAEMTSGGQTVRVLDLKRHLQGLCGQPRFRQRLLLPDGQVLSDADALSGPMDVQLVLVPFGSSSAQQLCTAASQNDTRTMEQLLQEPQDPNVEFASAPPLSWAAVHCCIDAVHLLLEARADTDRTDELYRTPLCAASRLGHVEIVRVLLQAKADKEKVDLDGATPMSLARARGLEEIVLLLDASN